MQIPLLAGHHRPASETSLNGVSLAFRLWPNIECWLGSFTNFKGVRTSIAKKPLYFCDFRGGDPDSLSPPPLDPHMFFMPTATTLIKLNVCMG